MGHTDNPRRATISLAAFLLICFFMPWVQVSCVGMKDSVSGYDLARAGDRFLWWVPAFMLAIIMFGIARFIWQRTPSVFALTSVVGGGLSAYLMLHERTSTNDSPRLVATQWTVLFWLAVVAAIGIAAAAFVFYARRSRSP